LTSFALRSIPRDGPATGGPILRGPGPAWAALFLNVLTFLAMPLAIPVPGPVGQMITQGALPAAIVLALLANPRLVVRPNLLLAAMSTMAVVALVISLHGVFLLGGVFRAVRLAEFVLVLWLLTPWWGREDLVLARCHLTCLGVALGSVIVGAVLAPGAAFSYNGRLSGALWPLAPTQVAHFAAVLIGCTAIAWFTHLVPGRTALVTVTVAAGMLLATHTRTALLALALGLAVAGASLFLGSVRVRRTAAVLAAAVLLACAFFTSLITEWLSRGQTAEQASQLTGRTVVWEAIFAEERKWPQLLFGTGLANKSYKGLSIDSNWVATYYEQGWFGVAVCASFLLILLAAAVASPRGPRRALGLFLALYCAVSSFTETGLGDASPYLLEIVVAAALLAPPAQRRHW
jgi:hypothetical protein